MIRRLFLITTLAALLSGCFMAPIALIGPAASGWSTTSIIQSTLTTGANYVVKKRTGKSFGEHALSAFALDDEMMQHTYFPREKSFPEIVAP